MLIYEKTFQGKRHMLKGLPCQDQCGYCFTPNGWIVAAVADGVSASQLSEKGARIAVESSLEYLSCFKYSPVLNETGIRNVLRDAFNYALRKIKDSESEDGFIPFSKYTTLHLLLYHPKIGLHWGQAGDGAIIIRNASGGWNRIQGSAKHKDEVESPVTLQDGTDFWQFGSVPAQEIDAILMTTDGIADAIRSGDAEKEVNRLIIEKLMSPPYDSNEGKKIDSYYQSLFFHENLPVDNESSAVAEAENRLSLITDDITIVLLNHLLKNQNTASEPSPVLRPESEHAADSTFKSVLPTTPNEMQPSRKFAARSGGDAYLQVPEKKPQPSIQPQELTRHSSTDKSITGRKQRYRKRIRREVLICFSVALAVILLTAGVLLLISGRTPNQETEVTIMPTVSPEKPILRKPNIDDLQIQLTNDVISIV